MPGTPNTTPLGTHTSPATISCAISWDADNKPHGWWSRITKGGNSIDLDLSAILITHKTIHEVIYFGQLTSDCGHITHLGDNRTGHGDGDDETITLNLPKLNPEITDIWFTLTSYNGHPLSGITSLKATLNDTTTAKPTPLTPQLVETYPDTTGLAFAHLTPNTPEHWNYHPAHITAAAKTAHDLAHLLVEPGN